MTAGHIRLLLVLMGLSLVWILCAKLIVPPVIESAYRGESWSFRNRMMLGQGVHSVHRYLQVWDKVTIKVLLIGLGFYLIVLVISSPVCIRRIVVKQPQAHLARSECGPAPSYFLQPFSKI